jgi:arylsulfatase A-like enzyme
MKTSQCVGATILVAVSTIVVTFTEGADHPNVILILTDNHGPWTLGCYGSPEIRTPHIDRLAEEGTLFERAYANNAVCSPTRATYMTGLMPCQHGVHRYLGAGGAQIGPRAYCTISEFRTLPKILHEAGYVCGLSGKWHLGGNMQPQEGFEYWITKPQ